MPGKHKAFNAIVYDHGLTSVHAKAIASALKADLFGVNDRSYAADVAVFPFPHPKMKEDVELSKKRGLFTIAYWLGSDVFKASTDYFYYSSLPKFDLHVVCHPRLAETLKKIGIEAEVAHLFSPDVVTEGKRSMIGVYLPHTGYNFFAKETVKIMTECPEYGFMVYGGASLDLPKNAENMGRITQSEVSALMKTCKGSIRLTRHDGFPVSIIDTKKHRRHVICAYPYEGCHDVKTLKEAVVLLKNGLFEKEDDTHWPGWYRAVCSEFNFKTTIEGLVSKYANLPR